MRRLLLLSWIGTLAASPMAAGQAPSRGAATIRGHVEIRRTVTPHERRPPVAQLAAPAVREPAPAPPAVVYLETAPRGAFEDRDLPRVRLDQRQETFVPHVLAIMAGTVVEFPNSDKTYHNVFSLSKAQRFDLGRYPFGRSKAVKFDRPGIVRVFCDIHSHMSAFVLVFGHPYFATTDSEGRYRIDRVPSGTYTLVAWYGGETRDTRTVSVPDAGSVEADFSIK